MDAGEARSARYQDGQSWESLTPQFAVIGGRRVVYRIAGDGPAMVLVHGLAGSAQTWRYVMPALAGRHTVLAPDLFGQGDSDCSGDDFSLDAQAALLRGLMDTVGIERATIVGQSLGGAIAMLFAEKFPERCERLVLVDSGGFGREVTFYLRMLTRPMVEAAFPYLCTTWIRDAGETLVAWYERAGVRSNAARREIWNSYASLADAGRRRAFFRTLREVIDERGQTASAFGRLHPATSLPTLILWGADDPFVPRHHAYRACEALPGCRLEVFPGVGHYPHCEAPERFVEVVLDFIDSTMPARLPAR